MSGDAPEHPARDSGNSIELAQLSPGGEGSDVVINQADRIRIDQLVSFIGTNARDRSKDFDETPGSSGGRSADELRRFLDEIGLQKGKPAAMKILEEVNTRLSRQGLFADYSNPDSKKSWAIISDQRIQVHTLAGVAPKRISEASGRLGGPRGSR